MIRGSVYPVDLGDAKRGREQRGRRYGIVLSEGPETWSTVVIVPTSTQAQPSIFRPELVVGGRETRALTDQIRTIDKQFVLGDPIDHLTRVDLAQVEYALSQVLTLRLEIDF